MADISIVRRITNALGITDAEPQISPAEQAQHARDDAARRRFATAGQELDKPEMIPVGLVARTPRATKPELPQELKREYQAKWQEVVQDETGKDAYNKLKALGSDIARISGNKKMDELNDADFKAFGLSKQQYDTVLSRVAMNTAVSSVKVVVSGSTYDLFAGIQGIEGMLADTEYAKKGGMKHAKEVMMSLSGTGISVAGYEEFKQDVGRVSAQIFGDNYKNSIAGQNLRLQASVLLGAIKMAGEDPADDKTIRKYTGESKQEFEEKIRQQELIGSVRGGTDRHFEIFMSISKPKPGKGL